MMYTDRRGTEIEQNTINETFTTGSITAGAITAKEFNDVTSTLRSDVNVLKNRANNIDEKLNDKFSTLEKRLDEEIADRKKISEDIVSNTRWHITQFIAIIMGMIGFFVTYYTTVISK